MAPGFCAHCGRPLPAGAAFCPACGAAVLTGSPLPTPSAQPPPLSFANAATAMPYPTGYPAPGYPTPGGMSALDRNRDVTALSKVSLAAILGLVGAVLSFVDLFGSPLTSLSGSTANGFASFAFPLGALLFIGAVAGIGLVFAFLELFLYRQAFRTLAPIDPRFSTPSSLVLAAIVGLAIVVLAGIGLFVVFYQAILCAGSGGMITTACLAAGTVLGLVGVLLVAAIIVLVGYIGLLVGIWRLGTRYNEGLFKVGAILLIIPILNLVGVILILVAARSARDKVARAGPGPAYG